MPEAVLFDLDGTLADTAPDLARALNRLRGERDLEPLPFARLRPRVSQGGRGLIAEGFGHVPGDSEYPALLARFLALYAEALCVETKLFDGIAELLDDLEVHGIRWGIVTNKAERFARPLIDALGLADRTACLIGGDTAPRAKPYPEPLLLGCERAGVAPERSLYVGDDERDIIAGRAAGMQTVAAAYGYLGCDTPLDDWQADLTIHHPLDLRQLLRDR